MPRDVRKQTHLADMFRKARGLSTQDNNNLVQLGQLIDGALNTRLLNNVGDQKRRLFMAKYKQVPGIKNLRASAVSNGLKVEWDPVDSARLSEYEIWYDPIGLDPVLNPGSQKANIGSTHIILDNPKGILKVQVRAVDRNGDVSDWTRIDTSTFPPTAFAGFVAYLDTHGGSIPLKVSLDLNTPPDRKLVFMATIFFSAMASTRFDMTGEIRIGPDAETAHLLTSTTYSFLSIPYATVSVPAGEASIGKFLDVLSTVNGRATYWFKAYDHTGMGNEARVVGLRFGAILA